MHEVTRGNKPGFKTTCSCMVFRTSNPTGIMQLTAADGPGWL
jgi:hypothetical protein